MRWRTTPNGHDERVDDDPASEMPERLARLEHVIGRELAIPAWRRHTTGERRWPSGVAIVCMIALQYALPDWLSLGPRWLMPVIEITLIAVLVAANPGRTRRDTPFLRMIALTLIGVASVGTAYSVGVLVTDIALGRHTGSAALLLATGGDVWLINVLTFAVWYWELDRGGPLERMLGTHQYPDFLFPQMTSPGMAPKEWEPQFVDYLYLAFTNATAFSPTDTLPLSRWAKFLMLLESLTSLATAALVIAKAINALA